MIYTTGPKNRFVANFVGITNIIKARVTGTNGDFIILESCEGRFIVQSQKKLPYDSDVVIFVRPENCVLKKDGVKMNTFTGKITNCEYLGDSTVVERRSKNSIFTAKISDTAKCTVGEDVSVSFLPEDCWILEDTNTNVKKCIQPVGGERSEAL